MSGDGDGDPLVFFYEQCSAERRADLADRKAERARLDGLAARVQGACGVLDAAVRAALRLAGYHQHNRQWRKRRMPLPEPYFWRKSALNGDLAVLISNARAGDKESLQKVRDALADDPGRFVEVGGANLPATIAGIMTFKIASGGEGGDEFDVLQWQALEVKTGMLRDELSGPDPSVVERLIVERVVICWLEVYRLDAIGLSAGDGDYDRLDRRRTRAAGRYLSALKTLASVRRLDLSPLQNIQNIQVNLGRAPKLEATPGVPLALAGSPAPTGDAPPDPSATRGRS